MTTFSQNLVIKANETKVDMVAQLEPNIKSYFKIIF